MGRPPPLRWVDVTSRGGLLTQCLLYAGTLSHEVAQLDRSNTGKTYAVVVWLPSWGYETVPRNLPLVRAREYAEEVVRRWFESALQESVSG